MIKSKNKNKKFIGKAPAVLLTNPKYAHNVGGIVRAASCWGVKQVMWSGDRVPHPDQWDAKYRIPREERMKGYKDVEMIKTDKFFDKFGPDVVPVAIELRENSENLLHFKHPENAVYVFGPEDGGLTRIITQHCHRFVTIPTAHCLNLSAAVNIILFNRLQQMYERGLIEINGALDLLNEHRGFITC